MDQVIQFEGTIYEQGYGLLAQKVMRDRELPKQSKLIYAYMCSFASVGSNGERTAFPSVATQCRELGMTEDTYYKWRKPLVEKGYISIRQLPRDNGKYSRNLYSILAVPVPKPPEEEKPKEEPKPEDEKPKEEPKDEESPSEQEKPPYPKNSGEVDSPYPNFSSTKKSSTKNSGTNSTTTNSTSNNNTNNNKNPNPNHREKEKADFYESLWSADIPKSLKTKIKVKVVQGELNLSINAIQDIEDAYHFQIRQTFVVPDCEHTDTEALNDAQFTNTVIKMLVEVEDISNMRGLIKKWVHNALSYKKDELLGSGQEYEVPADNPLYDYNPYEDIG